MALLTCGHWSGNRRGFLEQSPVRRLEEGGWRGLSQPRQGAGFKAEALRSQDRLGLCGG